ncbi:sensor histidine kinase [Variovorax ginsengisoli]|uniref:histidine kinase n=1 Tax=Variovorax ginsengisoli TaxID=363844 RepID=A0ABT9S7J4_9BURK|nr:HAMP domain-containing sensor histidine kinase [Variovorax ginsengisoli]MDP9900330.1 signal transduction histidine kinase [Variovorax ginsengisoli]
MQLLPPEPPTTGAKPRDYVIAFAAVMAALGLRFLMNPLLGQQGPYLILSLAIVVAAFYGGFGPALFATVLSVSIGTYFFIGSGLGKDFFQPQNVSRTVLFLLIGLSIAVIGGRLRTSRHDLAESVRQLRASNRAKDNAMATLGHEIRNPLAALHTAQEVLRRAPDDPKRVVWANELIGRQVQQMKRMADDLVDLSGVMRGEFQIDQQPVDLRKVLAQSLEQSGPLITKKGHRLHDDVGTAPVTVVGDATRLVQVFANLLNNAAKYTDPGGDVTLALRTNAARQVAVSVRDNGIGMQPGAIDELFEPFVQAPGAASNAEGGLGLGLAIVKKIVERHGGSVSAMSTGLGQGSTVTVLLPLAPGEH